MIIQTKQCIVISILLLLNLKLTAVKCRSPDGNRQNFLFQQVNTFIEDENDLHHYYDHYDNQEEDSAEVEDDDQVASLLSSSLVKEYNPNLATSLPDEIYQKHDLNEISEVRIIPSFLQSPTPSHYQHVNRVVLWYNPYCAHCQRFKYTFLSLAQEMHQLNNSDNYDPTTSNNNKKTIDCEFHAISCAAHHWLCKEYKIKGFPIVWVYTKNSTEYQILEDYTLNNLVKILDLTLPSEMMRNDVVDNKHPEGVAEKQYISHDIESQSYIDENAVIEDYPRSFSSTSKDIQNESKHNNHEVIDILGASNDIHKRTRNDIFHDAAMSLMHSLSSLTFNGNRKNSWEEDEQALVEYFDLLFWSLPPSWKVLMMVNDIRQNLKEYRIPLSETSLANRNTDCLSMMWNSVQSHQKFVLDGAWPEWTKSCRSQGNGFQCGLWNLIHIISIGVAERHKAVLGGRERVSTEHAAVTMKNFVERFIVSDQLQNQKYVDESNSYHIKMKNYWNRLLTLCKRDCGYKINKCNRFKRHRGKKSHHYYNDVDHWREFPLWLWEIHNEINVQILKEELTQKNQSCCSEDQVGKVIYPSNEICPNCHLDDGGWNRSEVYNFLKTQYWPSGIHNFRYVVLDVKDQSQEKGLSYLDDFIQLTIGLFIIFMCLYVWIYQANRRFIRKGVHKKCDD